MYRLPFINQFQFDALMFLNLTTALADVKWYRGKIFLSAPEMKQSLFLIRHGLT